MKEDARGKVVDLRGRAIPRNKNGDPDFRYIGPGVDGGDGPGYPHDFEGHNLLAVFDPPEIVAMCNRYIYAQEYQRVAHRNRARREAEQLQPLKDMLRKMFDVSHLQATDEQIDAAVRELQKERT